jgi:tyrosine-specific transport protein
MVNKKFLSTAFTLSGAIIGAGILGLPYVFSKSGFIIGTAWLIIFGAILILTNLYLGEITLRTKGTHQLEGYAKKYLGKTGSRIMFLAVLFGIYSALLAYLIGEGQSLSQLLTGTQSYAILFSIVFWLILTLLLRKGLRGVRTVETWGVLAIIVLILGIFFWFSPQINLSNLAAVNPSQSFIPIGVVMFSLLGFTAIPELRREIKGQEELLKKAIIIGALIPIILYIIFSLTVVGVLGQSVGEVATMSLGPIAIILGIFTMFSSFFVHSFILKDFFRYDLRLSKRANFFWTSIFPLLLFLTITIFNLGGFIKVLGIGGALSGGATGILILMMAYKAKKKRKPDRKPEYTVPLNKIIFTVLALLLLLGVIAEFMF